MRTATLSSTSFRLVAGAFAVACLTTLGRADVTIADYDDAEHFDYHVNYMPDLDQKRSGLPGNGSNFCVPTSMMNIFAYAAEWGFDDLDPGPGVWQGDVGYGTLTNFLDDLGGVMNSADGTSVGEWLDGMEYWLEDYPLVWTAYYKSEDYIPTLATAAEAASLGSLVAVCYGRYEFNPAAQPIVATDPESGHCVTMVHAHADDGDDLELWVRDPGDDGNLNSQSQWAYTIYDSVETMSVLQDWDEDSAYFPMDVTVINYDENDDIIRFLHKVYTITPAFGYDFDTIQLAVHGLADEITWGGAPTHDTFSPPNPSLTFGDVHIHPDLDSFVALVRGFPSGPMLMRADRRTGELSPLVSVPGATDFAVGRHRHLFVLAGNLVHRIDLEKPDVIEATAVLSAPAQAIATRDATDEVVVVSTSHRKMWLFPESLGSEVEPVFELAIPTAIPASTNPSIAVRESDGAVALVMPESPGVVWGLRTVDYTGLEFAQLPWSGPAPRSAEFDQLGRLLIGTDGAVWELARMPFGWWFFALVPRAESRYGDIEPSGTFRVLRSRTNFDERINRNDDIDTPAEILPEIGRLVYDCPGDFDNDGVIGFADLLSVLAKWGPCAGCPEDLDFDGQVGFGDLLQLLSRWGTCQVE
jgi:hypothetical protein